MGEEVANYTANPVGYLGIGFGSTATKGFTYGLDIGWLQTDGLNVLQVKGALDAKAVKAIGDDMFFGSALPNIQLNLGWGF